MASLKKRGRYYYVKFFKMVDGETHETVKSLGVTRKPEAEKALAKLEKLEGEGKIDPYLGDFDPQKALQQLKYSKEENQLISRLNTLRKAADYFYRSKQHLSNRTVNLDADSLSDMGTYQRAVELFMKHNDIYDLHPKSVRLHHFENTLYRDGIEASSTRRFYYRQLRVFWNFLRDRDIVEKDFFKQLRKDLPKSKENTRDKMISEQEFKKVFEAFDQDAERKMDLPGYHEGFIQHWFKPMLATYFYGGFRRAEIAYDEDLLYSGLKGKNLEYVNGELEMIYLPPGKGRTERMVPISKKWKKYLLPYLDRRGRIGENDYVFVYNRASKKGWPVTSQRVYRVFKKYLDLADLPKERTIHGMRHRRITTWLEEGFSLKEGQLMAGHSSASVTEGYTHLKGQNLLKKQREIEKRKESD